MNTPGIAQDLDMSDQELLHSILTALAIVASDIDIGLELAAKSNGEWALCLHNINDDGEPIVEYPQGDPRRIAAAKLLQRAANWHTQAQRALDDVLAGAFAQKGTLQ